ncbi:MAG: hypothetical protein ACFFE8_10325 [Candidatus Heimdallarchaeota archaeon]
MQVSRSVLVAVIGFLLGWLLTLYLSLPSLITLILGGIGYVIGLFLDYADTQSQISTFHFTNLNGNIQAYPLQDSRIHYSPIENVTKVLLFFEVKRKPENFRLGVLKNFADFEYSISEDDSRTLLTVFLEYPEYNYLREQGSLHHERFLFDIEQKGTEFIAAVDKIIPGTILRRIYYPSQQGAEEDWHTYGSSHGDHPSSGSGTPAAKPGSSFPPTDTRPVTNPPTHLNNLISVMAQPEDRTEMPPSNLSTPNSVNESTIMDDLLGEPSTPTLPPEEIANLQDSNIRALEAFLNEELKHNQASEDIEDSVTSQKPEMGELSPPHPNNLGKSSEIGEDITIRPKDSKLSTFDKQIIDRIDGFPNRPQPED